MTLDYQIVVPSRRRAENMPRLRSLLPDAYICVDQAERTDYAAHVPEDKLLLHPGKVGGPAVRNWIINNVDAPILVMSDDDFQGVRMLCGSHRFITNADDIRAIVENSARVCDDLDLTTFCYSRTANPIICQPDHYPAEAVHPVYGLFGIMGRARYRLYDEKLRSRADLDWSLRTFLEDRIVYCDLRFYFEFGASFSQSGGNSGLVSAEDFEAAAKLIKQRWGKHVSFRPSNFTRGHRQTSNGSIRVRRSARNAQR